MVCAVARVEWAAADGPATARLHAQPARAAAHVGLPAEARRRRTRQGLFPRVRSFPFAFALKCFAFSGHFFVVRVPAPRELSSAAGNRSRIS